MGKKKMVCSPLKDFIETAIFDTPEKLEKPNEVFDEIRAKVYAQAGNSALRHIEKNLNGKEVKITVTEEVTKYTDHAKDMLTVTVSLFLIEEEVRGFFKCPSCKKVIKI